MGFATAKPRAASAPGSGQIPGISPGWGCTDGEWWWGRAGHGKMNPRPWADPQSGQQELGLCCSGESPPGAAQQGPGAAGARPGWAGDGAALMGELGLFTWRETLGSPQCDLAGPEGANTERDDLHHWEKVATGRTWHLPSPVLPSSHLLSFALPHLPSPALPDVATVTMTELQSPACPTRAPRPLAAGTGSGALCRGCAGSRKPEVRLVQVSACSGGPGRARAWGDGSALDHPFSCGPCEPGGSRWGCRGRAGRAVPGAVFGVAPAGLCRSGPGI